MEKLRTFFTWLDDHILLLLSGFLLAFIPLFPKIPLWSPIEQYIVRVRLEDFILLLTVAIWGIQVLRKKVKWRSSMTWMIGLYALAGLLSVLSAVFITKTVPLQPLHVGKTLLHYFRYLEYFSFFFVMFSAVQSKKDAWKLLVVFAVTVISISIYGYGQKYHYWPVYSTMNREFSKGIRLYLTPHARVQSTFAGHYDMAAFLVLALPILLAVSYHVQQRSAKLFFKVAFWIGTWLLIVSASRTSFLAYVAGLGLTLLVLGLTRSKLREKITFTLGQGFLVLFITLLMFATFGEDLQERLSQVIDINPQVHDTFHKLNGERKKYISMLMGTYNPTPPPNSISTDQAIALGVLTPTDQRPEPVAPADTYGLNIPDKVLVATTSADGTTKFEEQERPRVFSPCALQKGLSLCIRLETLWPRAIKGFMKNPVLGSGYATLNKESVEQFTEAESTDNNFLRTLGETGLVGFVTFYSAIGLLLVAAARAFRHKDAVKSAFAIGIFCGTIGLLINAVYIDVFAASKVALTFWGLAGLFFAYLMVDPQSSAAAVVSAESVPAEQKSATKPKKKTKRSTSRK